MDNYQCVEIQSKTLLRKHKTIDSWFISRFGLNAYRGCLHNCAYCDGRAEKYRVAWRFNYGEFGKEISIKLNATEILERELDPSRKRIPLRKGFIMIGSGVGDAYQQVEKQYRLTRKLLQTIKKYNFPLHILTKSDTVLDDLDILREINHQTKAMVSFSFSSVNEKNSVLFEPGAAAPAKRLQAIDILRNNGISSGAYLMPVIPYITDNLENIEESFKQIKNAGGQYVISGSMTLKTGKQKQYFDEIIAKHFPNLVQAYNKTYDGNEWGNPYPAYTEKIYDIFNQAAAKYQMPKRIPAKIFNDTIDRTDLVVVILDQLDFLLKTKGENSPYGFAARSISQLKDPIGSYLHGLMTIKGVGPVTEKLIMEILRTGTCQYYEKNLF